MNQLSLLPATKEWQLWQRDPLALVGEFDTSDECVDAMQAMRWPPDYVNVRVCCAANMESKS